MRRILVDQLEFFEIGFSEKRIERLDIFVFKDLKSIGHLCEHTSSLCKKYEKKKSSFGTYLFKTDADSLQPLPVFVALYNFGDHYEKKKLNTARYASTYFKA